MYYDQDEIDSIIYQRSKDNELLFLKLKEILSENEMEILIICIATIREKSYRKAVAHERSGFVNAIKTEFEDGFTTSEKVSSVERLFMQESWIEDILLEKDKELFIRVNSRKPNEK